MINQAQLKLFQFCDSQFPTGAFSYSFGLETYIQREDVHDASSFQTWLKSISVRHVVSASRCCRPMA